MAIRGEKVLAVIPARAGSKRCPGKNLKPFRGKPLIAWSIASACQSKYIDQIAVSSEDEQIQNTARDYAQGESKVFIIRRPKELANDTAMNEDVLRHALTVKPDFDWIILLQPTSPLRTAEDIDKCLELAKEDGEGCVSFRKNGQKNGAVYCAQVAYIQKGHDFGRAFRSFYIMPDERSLDIDYAEQFLEG
jgi:CMP-N,N'-diacetyllegionaminic acid synthase